MRTSEATAQIAEALATAQASAQTVTKRGRVDAGRVKYDYVKPSDIVEAWQECGASHGLSVLVDVIDATFERRTVTGKYGDKEVVGISATAVCRLSHSSGEWMEWHTPVTHDVTGGMQPIGAVMSYARKYAIISALCLPMEDVDDARAREAEERKAADARLTEARALVKASLDAGMSTEDVAETIGFDLAAIPDNLDHCLRALRKMDAERKAAA